MGDLLSESDRSALLSGHKHERDGRVKDRITVVSLRDEGWTYAAIADALFLSEAGGFAREYARKSPPTAARNACISLVHQIGNSCSYIHVTLSPSTQKHYLFL